MRPPPELPEAEQIARANIIRSLPRQDLLEHIVRECLWNHPPQKNGLGLTELYGVRAERHA